MSLLEPPAELRTAGASDGVAGGDKMMMDALLSRLRHYCYTVTIDDPSLRDPQG